MSTAIYILLLAEVTIISIIYLPTMRLFSLPLNSILSSVSELAYLANAIIPHLMLTSQPMKNR